MLFRSSLAVAFFTSSASIKHLNNLFFVFRDNARLMGGRGKASQQHNSTRNSAGQVGEAVQARQDLLQEIFVTKFNILG